MTSSRLLLAALLLASTACADEESAPLPVTFDIENTTSGTLFIGDHCGC